MRDSGTIFVHQSGVQQDHSLPIPDPDFFASCRPTANQLCLMCWIIVVMCWFSVYVASKSKVWTIRYHYLADEVRESKEAIDLRKRKLFGFTRKITPLE
jgi:hypothetical protein